MEKLKFASTEAAEDFGAMLAKVLDKSRDWPSDRWTASPIDQLAARIAYLRECAEATIYCEVPRSGTMLRVAFKHTPDGSMTWGGLVLHNDGSVLIHT